MKRSFFALILFGSLALPAFSQMLPSPNDPLWRYQAWMETAGLAKPLSLGFYDSGPRATDVGGPWGGGNTVAAPRSFKEGPTFRLAPVEIGNAYNSAFPQSFNTGGVWYGVGFTPWLKAGFEARYGWLSLRIEPTLWFSENGNFPLGPSYPAQDPSQGLPNQPLASIGGAGIDNPQRYGYSPFTSFDWGNSELTFTYGVAVLSLGTQNFWFGPAFFNPLLLSSQAKGFPHIRLGIENWKTSIGTFQGNLLYGQLTTSPYWDPNVNNGPRFFGGLFLDYRPSFFPQLTIGLGRTIISYWSALDWQIPTTLFDFVPWPASYNPFKYGTGESHQHVSLTFQMLFPKVGFDVYGEWGKNDYSLSFTDYLMDLNHQTAYMLGFRKAFVLRGGAVIGVGAEYTNMSQNLEGLINYNGFNLFGDWNSHSVIREGYTNYGQVLAGGIGNGSAATLYADAYWRAWHWGLELTRYNPET